MKKDEDFLANLVMVICIAGIAGIGMSMLLFMLAIMTGLI